MSNDLDLNIDNYDLNDLLNLFKLPVDFDEFELKRAKQIVLKTHPDKSNLPRDYFIFYSKAYKTIYSIWEFRQKVGQTKNTEYSVDPEPEDEEKKRLLDTFFDKKGFKNSKNNSNFNEWFNKEFEKNRLQNEVEEKGYGGWLKDAEDEPVEHIGSMSRMHEEFNKKKSEARSLIVRDEIQDLWTPNSISSSNLSNEAPSTYDSGLFSALGFQDLYKAHHTETVIPVTEEDYHSVKKFNNVNEYVGYRNTQDTKPLSEQQALQYLKKRTQMEDEESTLRGYELAKQLEISSKKQQEFWSGLKLLK
jgi:hypothetical protein